jgi:hypothetical protein
VPIQPAHAQNQQRDRNVKRVVHRSMKTHGKYMKYQLLFKPLLANNARAGDGAVILL